MRNSKHQCGYVLLIVMLLIGSLGLYLTYALSTQKIKTQSWQLQKTATEISYWMDTEYNYAADQGILLSNDSMNAFSLGDLISNNYLPYGQSRYVTFPSEIISEVSEFMCSPLPGITRSDGTLQYSSDNRTNLTCPELSDSSSVTYTQHCGAPYTPAYYSCSSTMSTNNTQSIAKAQYYINANYISLGNLDDIMAGIGLIIRTPGAANTFVDSSTGQTAYLPNNSLAQSLLSLLPTSSFALYLTDSSSVNGIGIGTYLFNSGALSAIKNDRYSKIIDMGLVQAVDPTKLPVNSNSKSNGCCGWSADGKKIITAVYTGTTDCTTKGAAPPVCIQVDTTKFGPSGTVERCDRIDVLYTMFSDWQANNTYWYLNYSNTFIKTVGNHQEIYLSIHSDTDVSASGHYIFSSSGKSAQRNYLAYLVRCTRNNIP